jgi:protein required for attachment to host cells
MPRDRTWIIIADGGHVTTMESRAGEARLHDVPELHFSIELPATHDLVSDRAGRAFNSRGRARHAIEARTDPHRQLKRDFAKRIAKTLKARSMQGQYEHLVLIAPPVTLGDLRAALDAPTRARIRAELPSDLVKMPPRKLRRHLLAVLGANPVRRQSAAASQRRRSAKGPRVR